MEFEVIQANVEFEEIDSLDFIDALRTCEIFVPGMQIVKVQIASQGIGVDRLINWALKDINEAMVFNETGKKDDCQRKSTTAVVNARRALSCLVEWYMQRDGFSYCNNFEDSSEAKSTILLRMAIIDNLTTNVLKRLIDVRNKVEHEFESVGIAEAENIVELVRRTYDSLMSLSKPNEMPVIFGHFPYAYSYNGNNYEFGFAGWQNQCLVLQLFDNSWVGIALPKSKTKAIVRRVYLKDMEIDTLIDVHSYIYSSLEKYSKNWRNLMISHAMPKGFYFAICKLAGII